MAARYKKDEMEREKFDNALIYLIQQKPYYGYMLMSVMYVLCLTDEQKAMVPTAGIFPDGRLAFNPTFFATLTFRERVAVIEHEILHYALEHPTLIQEYKDKQKFNVAADVTINQWIKNLPKGCVTIESFAQSPKPRHLNRNLSVEDYYAALPASDVLEEELKGNMPQHHWLADNDTIAAGAGSMIAAAAEAADEGFGRGNLPAGLSSKVEKAQNVKKVTWRELIRPIVRRAMRAGWRMGWTRPNRRTGAFPARKRDRKYKLGLAIDTSGSTLGYRPIFLEYMDKLRKELNCDLVIVECDAGIGKTYEVKTKDNFKFPTEMSGGGGTSFTPALQWFAEHQKKHNIGLLLYFTDGWGDNPSFQPKFPVMWVEVGNSAPNSAQWGHHVKIPSSDLYNQY